MIRIKYVAQEHRCGCAIASIAMVLGEDYSRIENQFQNDFERQGLRDKEIADFVVDHGFSLIHKIARGYMDVQASNKRMAMPFADVHIVSVLPYSNVKMGHSVVMNGRGKIYDPKRPDIKDLTHYYCVTSVLGFFKEMKMATKGKSVKGKSKVRKGAKKYATAKDGKVKFAIGSPMDRMMHARKLSHTHVSTTKGGKKKRTRYDAGTKTSKKS